MEHHPGLCLARDADPELVHQPVDLLPGGDQVEEGAGQDAHLRHRLQPRLLSVRHGLRV